MFIEIYFPNVIYMNDTDSFYFNDDQFNNTYNVTVTKTLVIDDESYFGDYQITVLILALFSLKMIMWIIYLIVRYRRVQKQLKGEIKSSSEDDNEPV